MTSLEAILLAGMKLTKKNPEIKAYEALRVILNYVRKNGEEQQKK